MHMRLEILKPRDGFEYMESLRLSERVGRDVEIRVRPICREQLKPGAMLRDVRCAVIDPLDYGGDLLIGQRPVIWKC